MNKVTLSLVGLLTLIGGYIFGSYLYYSPLVCSYPRTPQPFTIDTVTRGSFQEWIPQTGTLHYDSSGISSTTLVVFIDELYQTRIRTWLMATTEVNAIPYDLRIVKVSKQIVGTAFWVEMKFVDEPHFETHDGMSIRLRIMLGEKEEAILLPIGGYYKDTMGEWLFVLDDNGIVAKRPIKLGRKNTEHFEVIEGLVPGDRFINNTYEGFENLESADILHFKEAYEDLISSW